MNDAKLQRIEDLQNELTQRKKSKCSKRPHIDSGPGFRKKLKKLERKNYRLSKQKR